MDAVDCMLGDGEERPGVVAGNVDTAVRQLVDELGRPPPRLALEHRDGIGDGAHGRAPRQRRRTVMEAEAGAVMCRASA